MEAESSSRKLSNTTDEEDDSSGNDETLGDSRRRRFCNERQHEPPAEPSPIAKKFKTSDVNTPPEGPNVFNKHVKPFGLNRAPKMIAKRTIARHHNPHFRHPSYGDRPLRISPQTDHPDRSTKKTYRPQAGTPDNLFASVPQQPVIHINPKFIQRFVEKSMKLAAQTSTGSSDVSQDVGQTSQTFSNKKIADEGAIQSLPMNTCPRSTLQAAAAMAIVRLVTECVEDDLQRNEKMNKLLTSRLLEQLIKDDVTSKDLS